MTEKTDLRPALRESWEQRREALNLKKGTAKEADAFITFLSGAYVAAVALNGEKSEAAKQLNILAFLSQVRGSTVLDLQNA